VADDLRENGGALDGVRALPAKRKNFSFRCQFPADGKRKGQEI
jgi:hypothetical protein